MIFSSAALGTACAPTAMPLPVMTERMVSVSASVYLGQAEEVVGRELVLAPAELARHLGDLVVHHLPQLALGEERQRREGTLAAARAAVAERHVEAGIDLLVVDAVQHRGHDV